mgnify:CR=1 FL=1
MAGALTCGTNIIGSGTLWVKKDMICVSVRNYWCHRVHYRLT